MKYVMWPDAITDAQLALVGEKALGISKLAGWGFAVPPFFVITASASMVFTDQLGRESLPSYLEKDTAWDLEAFYSKVNTRYLERPLPSDIRQEIGEAYSQLMKAHSVHSLAVRSSALGEDSALASFAGLHDTYLNVRDHESLMECVKRCWASLYTPRALSYRRKMNLGYENIQMGVIVQANVESKISGVMLTSDSVTGRKEAVLIEAAWGIGESIVQGEVTPDLSVVDKQTLSVVEVKTSEKKLARVFGADGGTIRRALPQDLAWASSLTEEQAIALAKYGIDIEARLGSPQDIEWAIDQEGRIYILQSRFITAFLPEEKGRKGRPEGNVLAKGLPASKGVATGSVCIGHEGSKMVELQAGDVLVAPMTSPSMVVYMHRASAIVTDTGGMICHAAITSREIGIPCVVGTGNATRVLSNGQLVTVDGWEGVVYSGDVALEKHQEPEIEPIVALGEKDEKPALYRPITGMDLLVILSVPDLAHLYGEADGALLRGEYIFASWGSHYWNLINEQTLLGREETFKEHFRQSVKGVLECFYPRKVWYLLYEPYDEYLQALQISVLCGLREEGYQNLALVIPAVPGKGTHLLDLLKTVSASDLPIGVYVDCVAGVSQSTDLLSKGNLTGIFINAQAVSAESVRVFADMVDKFSEQASRYQSDIYWIGEVMPVEALQLLQRGVNAICVNAESWVEVKKSVSRAERKLGLRQPVGEGLPVSEHLPRSEQISAGQGFRLFGQEVQVFEMRMPFGNRDHSYWAVRWHIDWPEIDTQRVYEWAKIRPEIIGIPLNQSLVHTGMERTPHDFGMYDEIGPLFTVNKDCTPCMRLDLLKKFWTLWEEKLLSDVGFAYRYLVDIYGSYNEFNAMTERIGSEIAVLEEIPMEQLAALLEKWQQGHDRWFAVCHYIQATGDDILSPRITAIVEEIIASRKYTSPANRKEKATTTVFKFFQPSEPVKSTSFYLSLVALNEAAQLNSKVSQAVFSENPFVEVEAELEKNEAGYAWLEKVDAHLAAWGWMRDRMMYFDPFDTRAEIVRLLREAATADKYVDKNIFQKNDQELLATYNDVLAYLSPDEAKRFTFYLFLARQLHHERDNHHVIWLKNTGLVFRPLALEIGRRLVAKGILADERDVFFLTVLELRALARAEIPKAEIESIVNKVANRMSAYTHMSGIRLHERLGYDLSQEPALEEGYY